MITIEKEIKKIPIDEQLVKDVAETGMRYGIDRIEYNKRIFHQFLERSGYKAKNNPNDLADYLSDYIFFTYIHEEKPWFPAVKDGNKHAKGRTQKEKSERSSNHFIKEVLPTLPSQERKHFKKKYGLGDNLKKK